jgi:hypothetical protein
VTKKTRRTLPDVRIEPELMRDAVDRELKRAAEIRPAVERYLAVGEFEPRSPILQREVDNLLRDLLDGRDVRPYFARNRKPGKRRPVRTLRLAAAIATEHARLVQRATSQGATEVAAVRAATRAIARKLRLETKTVQRAVHDWVPRYHTDDGWVMTDTHHVIEWYEAGLAALDVKKRAPGPK